MSFRTYTDHSMTDSSLVTSVRKATSVDETAPKRKHVRSCVIFTWDHHTAKPFWTAIKVQPIFSNEVQTFKALITIHRVLQEGHKSALRDSVNEASWLKACARQFTDDGAKHYGRLIRDYVSYLLDKLAFHKQYPEFNGTFEYKEYISLRRVDDPNEGYETIYDMMNLQDHIDEFQKQIFSTFVRAKKNECRMAALVPLVHESYGIYRFLTSMLRALYKNVDDASTIEPLKQRYKAQHHRLRQFYFDCSNLRYLTSLISIPRLPHDPPDLEGDDNAPDLPKRPESIAPQKTGSSTIAPVPTGGSSFPFPTDLQAQNTPASQYAAPEPIQEFWADPSLGQELAMQQQQQQQQLAAQQAAEAERQRLETIQQQQQQLAAQQAADMERQRIEAERQAQEFEAMQRMQAEAQRQAQEAYAREQEKMQNQGQLAIMQQQLMATQGQVEQDQMMLQQYDARVKSLENELRQLTISSQAQTNSKDDAIENLREQIDTWKNKYEALAKLYTQLRQEHLDLLSKYKQLQLKASSAQEATEKRERLEREMKNKNLELADMIMERDRARHELDNLRRLQQGKTESAERDLRLLQQKAEALERDKASELSSLIGRYTKEVGELENSLRAKDAQIADLGHRLEETERHFQHLIQSKDEELEIQKAAVDESLMQLGEMQTTQLDVDKAMDSQIDSLLRAQLQKLDEIIDSVLRTGIKRLDNCVYELDSPMQAGNQNATAEFLLTTIENTSNVATEFSTAFNNFFADGPNADHSEVINSVNAFSGAVAEVCNNTKGISRLASNDNEVDKTVSCARIVANNAKKFLTDLVSRNVHQLSSDQKMDLVIANNVNFQQNLQTLSQVAETYAAQSKTVGVVQANGNVEELVDQQLRDTAKAIQNAIEKLNALLAQPKNMNLPPSELQVHDSLLNASISITQAIARLIEASTAAQAEIVAQGKGSSSRAAFYKKNNRWTEGLISAAQAVARATNTLIETADGIINGNYDLEHLIVACNGVAAATAQLVAASRVKANFASKTQDHLEQAAKAVGDACKALVRQVQSVVEARAKQQAEQEDYSRLGVHEFRVKEMEQQVSILKLEHDLNAARRKLMDMRKMSYHYSEE
ncbi:huntingtin-interacting protein [Schizosaccharomyces japonicus yFS275]|uniref:Huntingtin-interacting protein n=1 Tax=Schizosaccharomyces japonicus (strain yFS275 / FY16936) TaxID=402676 RepID=B6JXL0_SCHJY|nr:huntingtin-interacting protein [Schizosaccharomyces japonicus yFS275]EEB05154.2 huntingtin-interacting protein [Schizosaccharomyces japonicus yFS275]